VGFSIQHTHRLKLCAQKNVREYVKWMMYWIVFAVFSFLEVFFDVFISWLPFYYELKIGFVLWLCLPATKGAGIVYRKLVHPQLVKNEVEIDRYIERVRDQSYAALIALGARGFSFATNVVLTTAIKGQTKLADTLQKSFSLTDINSDTVDFRSSMLSLSSNEQEENTENERLREDYQQSIRPQSLLRTADTSDDVTTDEHIATHSSHLTRRRVTMPREMTDRESLTPSPCSSSPSSGFAEDMSERAASPVAVSDYTASPIQSPTSHNTLLSRFFPVGSSAPRSQFTTTASSTSSSTTSSSSWRTRSSYTK